MKKTILLGDNKANRERYPMEYDNVNFVEMGNSKAIRDQIIQIVNENIK